MAIQQIKPIKPAVLPPQAVGGSPMSSITTDNAPQALTKPQTLTKPQAPKPVNNFQNDSMNRNYSTQTSGGLQGNINNQRYDRPQYEPLNNTGRGSLDNRGGSSNLYGNPGQAGGGSPQNTQGFGNFDQFRDSALSQAMRTLRPEMGRNDAAFEQMMVSRGIQPGTAQYDAQRANLDRRNSDLMSQATYGAQQQGLAAQQQAWNQDYQYDALANALNQASIGANASMANAQTGANASMYNSNNNLQAAQLANALGYSRLNEQGRQFDVNDIFRTQGQDINAALGFGQLGLGQQAADLNAFNANQAAQNQWWNQNNALIGNAPGMQFTPTGNLVGNTIQAGNNAQAQQNAQNSAIGGLLGAGLSMLPFSDKRLKENIELVDTVQGVNVYEFDYIDKSIGADRYRGVMAQEVETDYPDAVLEFSGFKTVDYNKLPVNMEIV
jgi:hypothetical protein